MRAKHNISAADWTNPFVIRGAGSFRAFLKAKEGVYPEVFFTFRRLSAAETELALNRLKGFGSSESEKVIQTMQDMVEERLVSWSFGNVDRERIECLVHPLLVAMYYIIVGTSATDPVPEEYLSPGDKASPEGEQKKS